MKEGMILLDRYEHFTYSISNISKHIMKIERNEMEKYGLRGSYAQYLVMIADHPEGMTSAGLAELCDKDKAGISRIISEMERKGLVKRDTEQSGNYRAKIMLTDKGREAYDYVCAKAERAVLLAGKGLDEESRKVFYAALAIFEANLRRISHDGIPDLQDEKQ